MPPVAPERMGAHPCVLFERFESDVGDSMHSLQVLVMQSFRAGEASRTPVETSALFFTSFSPLTVPQPKTAISHSGRFRPSLSLPQVPTQGRDLVAGKSFTFEVTARARVRHICTVRRFIV